MTQETKVSIGVGVVSCVTAGSASSWPYGLYGNSLGSSSIYRGATGTLFLSASTLRFTLVFSIVLPGPCEQPGIERMEMSITTGVAIEAKPCTRSCEIDVFSSKRQRKSSLEVIG